MSTPVIFTITPEGLDAAVTQDSIGLSVELVSITAHLVDGTEWGHFDLSGGIVEPTTHTARFSAILKSTTAHSAYQLKIWTSDDIVFAQAVSASPLVVVAANIDFAASFGLALTGTPAGSVTISINPDDSVAQALMMQHVGAANPHPQYHDLGSIKYFAMSTAPAGYLKANGAILSRTTYANLFSAIGTIFGAGDGSTTFKIPDLRGEIIRGFDDGRGIDIDRIFGSAQGHAIEKHNHYIPTGTGTSDNPVWGIPDSVWAKTNVNTVPVSGDIPATTYPQNATPTSSDTVSYPSIGNIGTFASETRMRNVALLACIKY